MPVAQFGVVAFQQGREHRLARLGDEGRGHRNRAAQEERIETGPFAEPVMDQRRAHLVGFRLDAPECCGRGG